MTVTLTGLRRGIILLEALAHAGGDGLTFGEMSDLFPSVPASTLSRLLKALEEESLIVKPDEGRHYRLGSRTYALASQIEGTRSLSDLVRPYLAALAEATGQSAAWFEFDGSRIVLTAKHEQPNSLHYMPEQEGNTNFSHHGFGKVALAWQPESVQTTLLSNRSTSLPFTPRTLQAELTRVRKEGILVNTEDDRRGVIRIAAAVCRDAQLVGIVGISFFSTTVDGEDVSILQKHVLQTATTIQLLI